jgi:hypothetical protein
MFASARVYFQIFMCSDSNYTVSLASGKLNIGQSSTSQSYRPHIRYTKLNFKVTYPYCSVMFFYFWYFISSSHHFLDNQVDTFFAAGSPVGVFLSLRNVRIGVGM